MISRIEHFTNMVQSGNTEAWSYLGYAYEDAGSYDKALECYKRGAALGDERAMHNLGVSYYIGGKYGEKNRSKAESLLEEAYKSGSGISASVLGIMYLGDYTAESIKKSVKWLEAAVDMGETDAMIFLALKIYLSDDYRMIDYHDESRGIRLLEQAASCGNYLAMFFLSDIYTDDRKNDILKEYYRASTGGICKTYINVKSILNGMKGKRSNE